VCEAIKAGYRLIDGAHLYMNEEEVGLGIRRGLKEADVDREDLMVTSKVWSTQMHPDDIEPACRFKFYFFYTNFCTMEPFLFRRSLKDLGLEYLDLYLMHWPHAYKRGEEPFPVDEDGLPQVH